MGSVIIPEIITNSSSSYYVVAFQGSVESKIVEPRTVSRQDVVKILIEHFEQSIKYLQDRKKQIFRSHDSN
jgi:hypothetical protein